MSFYTIYISTEGGENYDLRDRLSTLVQKKTTIVLDHFSDTKSSQHVDQTRNAVGEVLCMHHRAPPTGAVLRPVAWHHRYVIVSTEARYSDRSLLSSPEVTKLYTAVAITPTLTSKNWVHYESIICEYNSPVGQLARWKQEWTLWKVTKLLLGYHHRKRPQSMSQTCHECREHVFDIRAHELFVENNACDIQPVQSTIIWSTFQRVRI